MKNTRNISKLLAAFVAGIIMTGCSDSTEISEIVKPQEGQQANEVGYLSDEVSRALATLPGVSDVVIDIDVLTQAQKCILGPERM